LALLTLQSCSKLSQPLSSTWITEALQFDDHQVQKVRLLKSHLGSNHPWHDGVVVFERVDEPGQRRWILREMPDQTTSRISDRWANSSRVNRWIDSLRALRIHRSFSEDRSVMLGNLGLLSPAWIIEWSGRTLELGNRDSRGITFARLRMDGKSTLVELEGNALELLEEWKTLADLREQKLLALDPQEVDEIEFKKSGDSLKVARDGDTWAKQSGKGKDLKLGAKQNEALRDWLERVNDLRVQNFLAEPVVTAKSAATKRSSLTLRSFGRVMAQIDWNENPHSAFVQVYHDQRRAAFQVEKSEFAPLLQEIREINAQKLPAKAQR